MKTATNGWWLLTAIMLNCGTLSQARAQAWTVSLSGHSNEMIEVNVSTEQVPAGRKFDTVYFSVDFLDSNRRSIGARSYSYLDSNLPSLVPGEKYTRFFIHDIAGAVDVVGNDLSFDAGPLGDKGDVRARHPASRTSLGTATRVIATPVGSPSSKFERCKQYASAAEAQNNLNLAKHCGFTGSRWDSRFDYHYNWCLTVVDTEANNERNTRSQMLTSCGEH
jgi:hypothetical protein